jgi:hypothetical protein
MERRGVLVTMGSGLCASVSGCIGPVQSVLESDPSITYRDETTVTQFDDWLYSSEFPEDATATTLVQFGGSTDSHWVVVISESDTTVETTVTVQRNTEPPFYEETLALSSTEYAAFRFMQPSEYELTISSERHSETVEIAKGFIDCNSSHQILELRNSGEIEVQSLTEEVTCGRF